MGRPSGAFGGSFCKPSRNATAFAIRTTMPSGEVTIVVCRPSFRNPIRRWQGATARVLTRRGILVCAAACSLFRCGCMAGTNKGITAPVFPSGCGTEATNSTVDFIAVRGLTKTATATMQQMPRHRWEPAKWPKFLCFGVPGSEAVTFRLSF